VPSSAAWSPRCLDKPARAWPRRSPCLAPPREVKSGGRGRNKRLGERERQRERKREREEGWGDSLIDARSDSKINPNNDERFKNGSCFVQVGLWRSVPQDEGWRSVPQNVPPVEGWF